MNRLGPCITSLLAMISIVAFASHTQHSTNHPTNPAQTLANDTSAYIDIQVEPKLIAPVIPEYPARAKRLKLKGRAYVSVLIDTNGMVSRCELDHVSDPTFTPAALKAAKKARFRPAIQNGKPVAIWWMLAIYFPPPTPVATVTDGIWVNGQTVPTAHLAYMRIKNDDAQVEPILVDSFQHYVVYPEQAKRRGLEGTVALKVLLDSDGNQTRVDVVSLTDSIFLRPALDAIAHARFAAPKFYSHSDTATAFQTVVFRLDHALDRAYSHLFPTMPEISADTSGIATPRMRFDIKDLIEYPKEAKDMGLQGAVNVAAEVNEHGIVLHTTVEASTNPIFDSAAQAAVEHMLFEPAQNASGPIKTWCTVPVVFRLPHDTH